MYSNVTIKMYEEKNCKIRKSSKMVSTYTIFEVDQMPQHTILKIASFGNCFQHHLPFDYKKTFNQIFSTIVKS